MALRYGLWIGITVLVVYGLGRLKRWLLALAVKKKRPEDQGV